MYKYIFHLKNGKIITVCGCDYTFDANNIIRVWDSSDRTIFAINSNNIEFTYREDCKDGIKIE